MTVGAVSVKDDLAKFRTNAVWLLGGQVVAYAIPVFVTTYIVRVLGSEAFDVYALTQSVAVQMLVVANLGFDISITKRLAGKSRNLATAKLASGAWACQWATALVLVATVGTLQFFGFPSANFSMLGVLVVVASSIAYPSWLVSGLETFSSVSVGFVGIRLLIVPGSFVLVQEESDLQILFLLYGLLSTVAGFYCWFRIWRSVIPFPFWIRPKFEELLTLLKESRFAFGSTLLIGLYLTLGPILLTLLKTQHETGRFAIANQIRVGAVAVLSPLSAALFPRATDLFARNRGVALHLVKRSLRVILTLFTPFCTLLFLFPDQIVKILAGQEYPDASEVLRVMAFQPLLIGISTVLGLSVLVPQGKQKEFSFVVMSAAALNLLVVVPIIRFEGATGLAGLGLLTELLVSIAFSILIFKQGLLRKVIPT